MFSFAVISVAPPAVSETSNRRDPIEMRYSLMVRWLNQPTTGYANKVTIHLFIMATNLSYYDVFKLCFIAILITYFEALPSV